MAAAGVRTTKGLYFIFTLLGLVCLASSLIDNDQLKKLKQDLQKIQQGQDSLKVKHLATMVSLSTMNEYMNVMEQLEALVKKTPLPDDFPSMEGLLQSTKGFVEKITNDLERVTEKNNADIEEIDEEVRKMMKLVEFLEENQAEL